MTRRVTGGLLLLLLVAVGGTAFAAFKVSDDDLQAGLFAVTAALAAALSSLLANRWSAERQDVQARRDRYYRVVDLAGRYDRARKLAHERQRMHDALTDDASPKNVAIKLELKRQADAATQEAAAVRGELFSALVVTRLEAGTALLEVLDTLRDSLEQQVSWTPDEEVTGLEVKAIEDAVRADLASWSPP